jgi:hypothetical protein
MHFLSSLLRIMGLYMFRALLTGDKGHLVYCVRVMSVGCTGIKVELVFQFNQLTYHARNIPSAACVAPPEDEQVMLETCTG